MTVAQKKRLGIAMKQSWKRRHPNGFIRTQTESPIPSAPSSEPATASVVIPKGYLSPAEAFARQTTAYCLGIIEEKLQNHSRSTGVPFEFIAGGISQALGVQSNGAVRRTPMQMLALRDHAARPLEVLQSTVEVGGGPRIAGFLPSAEEPATPRGGRKQQKNVARGKVRGFTDAELSEVYGESKMGMTGRDIAAKRGWKIARADYAVKRAIQLLKRNGKIVRRVAAD